MSEHARRSPQARIASLLVPWRTSPAPSGGGLVPERAERLGDFTYEASALRLLPLAIAVGVVATAVAAVLIGLIGLFTNLLYFGRLDARLVSPAGNTLGPVAIVIPVLGGLVIGVMARFGSERIRGHGIPEAMETILVGGSRVEPRLAILKPISSAISIGSGGPFGAEGPVILTGGAFGSLVGQSVHLSAAERKTLLVAGAAAGMTAVFGTPIASVLLAVELLLFELKPRSLIPVAVASIVAAALRAHLASVGFLAPAPLFPVPAHPPLGDDILLGAVVVGLIGGLLAWLLTVAVYGAEDAFGRLPIHWMWWPVIGGLVIGIGGALDPRVLGVGYDSVAAELAGRLAVGALASLLVVKLVVWSVALGSGTSGGILAPLLLIGGAMGGLLGPVLPGGSTATWALIGMAATMAGVMRSPLTSAVFAFELTRDTGALPALLVGCVAADLVSVLVLKRSILTEKVARRGFHVMREYAVEPLEALYVRDVMRTSVLTVPPDGRLDALGAVLQRGPGQRLQRLYPVIGADGVLLGVVGRHDIETALAGSDPPPAGADAPLVADVMRRDPIVAHPDETLRTAADRMAARRVGVLPVVDREDPSRLRGLVNEYDLLRARDRLITEERHRERVLRLRFVPSFGRRAVIAGTDDDGEAA